MQQDVHPNLSATIGRYRQAAYQRPLPDHQRDVLLHLADWVAGYRYRVVLDHGCGTGMSTRLLALQYPHCAVIGIDKSQLRLSRDQSMLPDNARLVRADVVHFLRLAHSCSWQVIAQYFLYPNPWPKPRHLKRRWHAHPIFPTVLALGGAIQLRTNWEIYAQEFSLAVRLLGGGHAEVSRISPTSGISRFEQKYRLSGHALFQVSVPSAERSD